MKQTAALFLYEFVMLQLTDEQQAQFDGLFQQALDMEKQQIIETYDKAHSDGYKDIDKFGEQYYKEIFEKSE